MQAEYNSNPNMLINHDRPTHNYGDAKLANAHFGNNGYGNHNRRALADIGNFMGTVASYNIGNKDSNQIISEHRARMVAAAKDFMASTRVGNTTDRLTQNAINYNSLQAMDIDAHQSTVNQTANHHFVDTRCYIDADVAMSYSPQYESQQTVVNMCHEGFEVEMAEADHENFCSVSIIDEADIGNPLAVVDYIEDLHAFYRETENQSCVPTDYMSRHSDINEKMRAILIDWLIEVHHSFKLAAETLFLTVNIIDRFLACNHTVKRNNLQLVGVTAMLIASKYEEVWAPEVQDFVSISDNAYTREQVLDMEKQVLNKLQFNLSVPTQYVFLKRFLKAAGSESAQMEMLAFFLTELCLTEYSMMEYSPSHVAATAVYVAQHTLIHPGANKESWSSSLQHHTGYTDMHLRDCALKMLSFHARAGQGKLTVVFNKYNSPNFHSVASLHPAVALPMLF